jgi:hypothetical protein
LGGFALLALVVGIFAALPHTSAAQNRYSLKVMNRSKFDIYHLYMSSTEEDAWGPDQLGDDVLSAGGTHTITNIKPGEYDIKVVDEDGDKCVLNAVKMFEDKQWDITTAALLKCEGFH